MLSSFKSLRATQVLGRPVRRPVMCACPRARRITLIRHGPVAIRAGSVVNASCFRRWLDEYDGAALEPGAVPPSPTHTAARSAQAVFTSTLRRALESAQTLGHEGVTVSPLFDEPRCGVPNWRVVHMPCWAWLALSRFLWLSGFDRDGESLGSARKRAACAADLLISSDAAEIMLVGHGWMNKLIGLALAERGWLKVLSGSTVWSTSVLTFDEGPSGVTGRTA